MADTNQTPALLPCPLCGGKAMFGRRYGDQHVECCECQARTGYYTPTSADYCGLAESSGAEAGTRLRRPLVAMRAAAYAWNRRAVVVDAHHDELISCKQCGMAISLFTTTGGLGLVHTVACKCTGMLDRPTFESVDEAIEAWNSEREAKT